jgi:hypothetical protein
MSRKVVVLSLLGLVLLLAQQPGKAQSSPPNALPFFKNYFITGDYRVGSIDLSNPVGNFVTGDIHFNNALGNAVPANADVVAAFLYWEMITLAPAPPSLAGARFRDQDISTIAKQLGPAKLLTQETSPCWTGEAGDVFEMRGYRADVLRFLHVPVDANGNATGKRLVNDVDYIAAAAIDPSVVPLRVTLPEASGNQVPSSAGASLMVIYKDQDPTKPLKSVVIYNGAYTQLKNPTTHVIDSMTQKVRGFYQLAASPQARMTHLVGSSAGNSTERLWVGNDELSLSQIATDPFMGVGIPSSDRAWTTPTFPLSISGAGGEYAMKVDHGSNSPYDCLTWIAIVSSAIVEDTDKDGLLNEWETDGRYQKITHDSAGNVIDARFGKCTDSSFASDPANCVDFPKMGALPGRRDIFIEFGYMRALTGTMYGIEAPQGGVEHDHRPDPEALEKVGKAFDNAPGSGIKVHFDLGDDYPAGTVAEPYLIRDTSTTDLARGGESIIETGCDPLANPDTCLFSAYPGTVPWKTGFRFLRDESLSHRTVVSGVDVGPDDTACVAAETDGLDSTNCLRRFDSNRKDTFRYSLWAHALGSPKVDDLGAPLIDAGSYIPRNISGVADGGGSGGGDFMITLGAFGSHVGNESVQAQASTLMHELGHTLRLRHGSVLGGDGIISKPEANCRPNYQSVMNYLYQIRGLVVDTGALAGTSVIDYSRQMLSVPIAGPSGPKLSENSLTEAPGTGLKYGAAYSPYRARWFSPTSLGSGLSDPVTRHCDGTRFTQSEIDAGVTMFSIDATTAVGPIDWNWNGVADAGTYSQDINFNRGPNPFLTPATVTDGPFSGFNDWANIDLRQVGSRRNVVSTGLGGAMSLDMGLGDFGLGDFGLGDFGLGDFGLGDFGLGDFGLGDFGLGDFGLGDFGQSAPELDLETALALGGGAPNALAATLAGANVRLRWASPPVGEVATYEVFRVVGPSADSPVVIRPADIGRAIRIGIVAAPLTEFLDAGVQLRGRTYGYFVIAVSVEGVRSPHSNLAVILIR